MYDLVKFADGSQGYIGNDGLSFLKESRVRTDHFCSICGSFICDGTVVLVKVEGGFSSKTVDYYCNNCYKIIK